MFELNLYPWREQGAKWKTGRSYLGTALLIILLIIGVAHFNLMLSLKEQFDKRTALQAEITALQASLASQVQMAMLTPSKKGLLGQSSLAEQRRYWQWQVTVLAALNAMQQGMCFSSLDISSHGFSVTGFSATTMLLMNFLQHPAFNTRFAVPQLTFTPDTRVRALAFTVQGAPPALPHTLSEGD